MKYVPMPPNRILPLSLCLLVLLLSLLPSAQAADPLSTGEKAWIYQQNRRPTNALALLQPKAETEVLSPRECHILARCLDSTEQSAVAESLFHAILEKNQNHGGAYVALAALRLDPNQPAAADSLLDLASSSFSANTRRDSIGQMIVFELKGWLRLNGGDFPVAAELYRSALARGELLPTPIARIEQQNQLARALTYLGQTEEAAEILPLVVSGAEEYGLPDLAGNTLIHQSVLARWAMDLDLSLAYRHQALAAYEGSGNQTGQARALHYIAAIHLIRGDLTKAMKFLQRALAMAEATEDVNAIASVHGDIGSLYYFIGDTDRALGEFTTAVEMGEGISDPSWLAGHRSNIATILIDNGDLEEALTHLDRSLTDMRQSGHTRLEGHVLSNIGRCLCEMGDYDSGVARLDEGARSAHEWDVPMTEAFCLVYLAECHLQAGELVAAEEALYQAASLSAAGSVEREILLVRAKLALARSNRIQALSLLEEAIAFNENIRNRSRGLSSVASSFLASEMSVYEQTIHLMWDLFTSTDLPDDSGTAAESVQLNARKRYDQLSFSLAQKAKARSFLDMLTEAEVDLRPHADPRYLEREDEILTRINELITEQDNISPSAPPDSVEIAAETIDRSIARLEDDLIALEEELREADPRYTELIYPHPSNLQEVQSEILRPGDLLLEYMLGDSASFVWAVTQKQFRWVKLPPRAEIEALVQNLLPLVEDYNLLGSDPTYFVQPAADLASVLLGGVQDLIDEANQTLVAPQGILHYLPFDLLPVDGIDSTNRPHSFADLNYLIDQTTLVYVPSISALSRLRASQPEGGAAESAAKDLLVIGDPIYRADEDHSVFAMKRSAGDPLAYAAHEITSIRRLFQPERVTVYSGAMASPYNLRKAGESGSYRLIHIAAHGIYNEISPQYSGLMLSPDAVLTDPPIKLSEDGYMTAEEVFGLQLPCRQLVLSACSSALGKHVSGEGVTGLVRAFLYAGASSVVASLWDVDDHATSEFMLLFYQKYLEQEEGGGAAALAETKRWLIHHSGSDRLSHPYFWAAFTLTGEGD